MFGKRFGFWLGVAGVSILANFGLEYLTHNTSSPGLASFTAFAHKGAS